MLCSFGYRHSRRRQDFPKCEQNLLTFSVIRYRPGWMSQKLHLDGYTGLVKRTSIVKVKQWLEIFISWLGGFGNERTAYKAFFI